MMECNVKLSVSKSVVLGSICEGRLMLEEEMAMMGGMLTRSTGLLFCRQSIFHCIIQLF